MSVRPENDCLSSGDALFLYFEREGQPVNVAAVSVFEGVIPLDLCAEYIESKLPLIPRYRQRVVAPAYNIDLPSWEYDRKFDIRHHVREVALRRGTEAEFKTVAAKLLSTTMDREHPLWDFSLVRGLKSDRTGVVLRMHHCLVDGISGVGLLNVLMDANPAAPPLPKRKRIQAPPAPDPGILPGFGLITASVSAAQRLLTASLELLDMGSSAAKKPPQTEKAQTEAMPGTEVGALDKLKHLLEFSVRLPFNVVCTGPQKFGWAEIPLAEIKAVKQACGATVNDVVLTIVTAAIRRYAELHGVRLKGRRLRIIIPVNLRAEGEVAELGNRISFMPVNIPLDIRDPRKLIAAVREATERGKNTHVAELVGLVGALLGTIPTALQALLGPLASRLPLSLCNLICTNVPGPQYPLYLLGHKQLACYPYVPIGGEMGMNCAILTYNGTAYFGFTGDAHAIPDLKRLETFLTQSFAELRKAAGIALADLAKTPATRPT
jgi:diacylglycerol O-acyltransferase